MIVTMSSPYRTINGNETSDRLDTESKSSVNIAAEILEAQRIVTRRLQRRREKEKNQRQKIYEYSKDNISTDNQTLGDMTTTDTTTTSSYNTRLEHDYSPLSYRKSTFVVGHNSSDEENDDATKIDDSFGNSDTENIINSTSRLKNKTEMQPSTTEGIVDDMNYFIRPETPKSASAKLFNIKSSLSTPTTYRRLYPNIPNSVPRSSTFLKLSKEETLVNDDSRKEPSVSNKFSKQHIGLSYHPKLDNHSPISIKEKIIPQINNNDESIIEEDLLYKENPLLYYIIYPIKLLLKFVSLLLYGLYKLFTSKPFILLLVFSIGYCTIDSRYIDSILSEFKYISGIKSITSRNGHWKSLWNHVRSPFSVPPVIHTTPTSPFKGSTDTYNRIIENLNNRLDNIQAQINVLTDKTVNLAKDSKELSEDFNKAKYNDMFKKFKDDLEQISQEINKLQDNYKNQINTLFDKKITTNNEKLVQFEKEIGSMKNILDNYKIEVNNILNTKSSDSDLQKLRKDIEGMNDKIKELGKKTSSSKNSEKINENEKKLTKLHSELSTLFDKFKDIQNQIAREDSSKTKQFESIHGLFKNANQRLTEVEDRMNKLNVEQILSFTEGDQKQNLLNYIDLNNRQKEDHEQLEEIKNKWGELQSGLEQNERKIAQFSDTLKSLSENQEKLSKEYDELIENIPGQVADITEKTLRQDIIGLPDYALESGGARIISKLTTDTYKVQPEGFIGMLSNMLGVAIKPGRPPTEAIRPTINAGECWAMKGTKGVLTLKLAKSIIPSQITVEHLAKEISFSVSSAPRFIEIYGIHDIKAFSAEYLTDNRNLVSQKKPYASLIGKIEYNPSKKPLQSFDLQYSFDKPIQYVQFQFTENWGNPDYTCIYRIRVHGTPVNDEEIPNDA